MELHLRPVNCLNGHRAFGVVQYIDTAEPLKQRNREEARVDGTK